MVPRPTRSESKTQPRPVRGPSPSQLDATLRGIIGPLVEAAGFDLIELQLGRNGNAVRVAVYVDRLPGQGGIGIDECAAISRRISAVFELDDPIPTAWDLEVSSPGLQRVLRHAADMERFAGVRARITTAGEGGLGKATRIGEIVSVQRADAAAPDGAAADAAQATTPSAGESVTLRVDGGKLVSIALVDITRAQLDPTPAQWQMLGQRAERERSMHPDTTLVSDPTASDDADFEE